MKKKNENAERSLQNGRRLCDWVARVLGKREREREREEKREREERKKAKENASRGSGDLSRSSTLFPVV